jgi:CubicO group peptidase (beta-lactamase class C family)
MSKYGIPGLAVAVVRNGKVLKLKGYGLASVEFDIPATENSIFQIYSTTKIFAGVAIMKLVEDGKLSLDTPVTDVVENLPSEWKAIRVRHLLTHTSGLPETSDNSRFANLPEEKRRGISWEEGIRFVAEVPLKFKPGDKFSYHRSGYNLLALIVERLSKKTFAAFLEERVFAPLGMSFKRFGDSEMVIKGRPSTAYNRGTGELRNWVYSFGFGNPGAGLNSSASDLSKFMVALDAGKVLKQQSVQALWTPAKLNDGTEKNYGLGWSLDRHKGRRVVGHEGGGAAWVAHFPAEHMSIVVLCNLNGARADEIQYGIADFYLGQ